MTTNDETMQHDLHESFKNMLLARARVDEKTIEHWLTSGMKGKLTRRGDGPIRIEPCDPDEYGQLLVHHYLED